MLILAVATVPVIPATWIYLKEERSPPVHFRSYIHELWELIQSRAMYQVIAYKFFSGIFEKFTYTASAPMASYWAKVTPLNDSLSNVLSYALYAIVLHSMGTWGLNWNWRYLHAITIIAVTIIDAFTTLLTTWNVERSQWFWLGPPILENLPSSISFIVSLYVAVELAGEGNEGAVYGLLSSVTNMPSTVASTVTKNVDAQFDVGSAFVKSDTNHVRWQVTYTLIIAYTINLSGLLWLPLLPPQKRETQELKAKGGKNKILGAVTIFYLLFSLAWSVMINIMSIYPSTKCLKIVGGTGCHKK